MYIDTPWGMFPTADAASAALEPTFITGDIVALISGGPALSVIDHCDECGETEVAWFEGDTLRIATFPEEVLFLVDVEDDSDDVPYSNGDGHTLH